ncbi:hypothetical protein B0H10DRAFT_2238583 [Mycena sp. CBHHK59/15]|nr:hypothetical protein B0H10DRAFT_2238583 [Mycena sp. CBHHK59/15]
MAYVEDLRLKMDPGPKDPSQDPSSGTWGHLTSRGPRQGTGWSHAGRRAFDPRSSARAPSRGPGAALVAPPPESWHRDNSRGASESGGRMSEGCGRAGLRRARRARRAALGKVPWLRLEHMQGRGYPHIGLFSPLRAPSARRDLAHRSPHAPTLKRPRPRHAIAHGLDLGTRTYLAAAA